MKNLRRILALSGVIVLAALYISTLILAFFQNELAQGLLMSAIALTLILPIVIHFITVGIKNTEANLGEDSLEEEDDQNI